MTTATGPAVSPLQRSGEDSLALEEIARALAQDMIAITGQEREDILVLARQVTMDGPVPHALGFCPTCVPAAP
jgi:hypothetical protein